MKAILSGIMMVVVLGICVRLTSCTYTNQTEATILYDYNQEVPPNDVDNPLQTFGLHGAFGINKHFFSVNTEENSFEFTATPDKNSPYSEAVNWDSIEGATMQGNFTIKGRVVDIWKFFIHFHDKQYNYGGIDGVKDSRVYEAIRLAAGEARICLNEEGCTGVAEDLRKDAARLSNIATARCKTYMAPYGFEITRVDFSGRITYPDGSDINKLREDYDKVVSRGQQLVADVGIASNKMTKVINAAVLEAQKITGKATRLAAAIDAESLATASALSDSIEQVGVDLAVKLTVAETQKPLIHEGIIQRVVLTEDSSFGQTFYPPKSE